MATAPVERISPFSAISIHIRPYQRSSHAHAIGSGMLWDRDGEIYLVSNLHNISGWDFTHNRAMSQMGWLPDAIDFHVSAKTPLSDSTLSSFGPVQLQEDLYKKNEPAWLVHPAYGETVDVAALHICSKEQLISAIRETTKSDETTLFTIPANKAPWNDIYIDAGDDAYVLGFPKGMSGGGPLPVWKRASVASEPGVDLDGLPKVLVDTATRQGMSGSPVIAVLRRGVILPNGKFDQDAFFGQGYKLLGVYSGRIGEDELGVQLGVVWKARVIDEIIEGGRRGTDPR